jgi:hypothetical protein
MENGQERRAVSFSLGLESYNPRCSLIIDHDSKAA